MDNVGFTDGDDSSVAYHTMKMMALERCLIGKPFLVSGTGNRLVPDFNNPSILSWLFPHLDPWGIGGFYHPARRVKISMEEQLCHMLKTDDPVLERDPEFAFVFFNVVRKYNVARCVRFRVPRSVQRSVIQDMLNIDPDVLVEICRCFENNPLYRPEREDHKRALRTLKSVSMMARNVPGSDGYKVSLRNEIRATIYSIGTPSLFVTLNPSDVDNPIVRLFAGEDIVLEDMNRGEDMKSWTRKLLAARNPGACARFFDFMVRMFVKVILRYGENGVGLFGRCTGYYGVVEAQGRGSLHCHMLVWLDGHLSPQDLREKLVSSPGYAAYLYQWLDSIIMNDFPSTSGSIEDGVDRSKRVRSRDTGDPHPGAIPGPSFTQKACGQNMEQKWREFKEYLISLLYEYNWHEHTATCWKYLRKGELKSDKNCRMRMDGVLEPCTRYDPEATAIVIKRLHPKVSSYNDVMTFLMKCNVNIQFVGPGEAAKAYLYYVTDYITKPSLPVHVGFSALSYAIKKIRSGVGPHDAAQSIEASPGVAITVANSMMGRQEVSHPQVMSYLVGGGDHYTPFKYQTLQRWSFVNYVTKFFEHDSSETEGLPTRNELDMSDEQVELSFSCGQISENSQVLDYCMRPNSPEFEDMCLYDFVVSCVKRSLQKGLETEDLSAAFSSWEHPQRHTHSMSMRREKAVPVLLGPAIPDPNKSSTAKEIWARDVLILFKPWRLPIDLKGRDATWTDAFEKYAEMLSDPKRLIIKNIQVLAECSDARDGISKTRNRSVIQQEEGPEEEPTAEMAQDDMDGPDLWKEQHNSDVFRSFSSMDQLMPDEDAEVEVSATVLHGILGGDVARLVELCFPRRAHDGVPVRLDSILYSGIHQLRVAGHSDIMNKKRKRRVVAEDDSDSDSGPQRRRARRHDSPFAEITSAGSWFSSPDVPQTIIDSVVRDMGLESNEEQLRAFRIVAEHVVTQSLPQLLMYISGVGGTGKSHVIKSLVMLFERLGRRRELLLGAPTGIAAILIGGQTLHSLILTCPSQKSTNLAALTAIWKGVHYLIVDEISMIGAQFLSETSNRIRQAKGDDIASCDKPFGGVNVVFVGDLGQLKPPRQYALYSHELVLHPSFSQVRDATGINSMNGALLWRQVNVVVELVKNVCHSIDPRYGSFLGRLRVGCCIPRSLNNPDIDDYEYLQSRLLSEIARRSMAEFSTFSDAPIIVGSKALRDALNVRLVAYHASRLNTRPRIYYSRDTSRKSQIPMGAREYLWSIPSSENGDSFGRLPLFVGMKVMVTENIAFDNKIVNGTEGEIRSIYHEEGDDGKAYAVVAYVHVPGSGFKFPDLDADVVPIFPTKVHINRKGLRSLGIHAKGFTRLQLPLVPAYVYTDFKSQGRTLVRVIVDLVTARGQGVYVMLSRVTSLSGLAILRWFPSSKVFHRIPQELRNELERLRGLL